ncbi:ABC transporter permease [Streptomyces microflavus]|uniref:ABC transporter permease n=1 Tax=Streptomyces microflavus TaxID=1919 RepID=UPI00381347AF
MVDEFLRTVRLAWRMERAAFRGEMQYRSNFLAMVALGIVYQGAGFGIVLVVMHTVNVIGGWSLGELAFLYGLRMLAHAMWVLPLGHLWSLDQAVREAHFDRYLLRPLSPFLQFLTSRVQLNAFGDLLVAVIVLGYSFTLVDIHFTVPELLYLATAVCGGALIEVSVQIALACAVFRTLNTSALRNLADSVFGVLGSYPLTIFSSFSQYVLAATPIAFVAYFPAALALGKTEFFLVPQWYAALSLPVGVLMALCAASVWRSQMRHYQSAGN